MIAIEQKVDELFELLLGPGGELITVEKTFALIAEIKSGCYGDPVPEVLKYLAHSDPYVSMRALDMLFEFDLQRAVAYSFGDERALSALQHAEMYDQGCDWEDRKVNDMARKAMEAIARRMDA